MQAANPYPPLLPQRRHSDSSGNHPVSFWAVRLGIERDVRRDGAAGKSFFQIVHALFSIDI